MSSHTLTLGAIVIAYPGDTFSFDPPDAGTQYHVEVSPGLSVLDIEAFKNAQVKGAGVSKNQPSKPCIDHVFGKGHFVIIVTGAPASYSVKVTANSWWKKTFGWGF